MKRKRVIALAVIAAAIALAGCAGPSPDSTWNAGKGGTYLHAVHDDLAQISLGAAENDLVTMEQGAVKLFADASQATKDPPPVDGSAYTKVMAGYIVAALFLQPGSDLNLTGAEKSLQLAGDAIPKGAPWGSEL